MNGLLGHINVHQLHIVRIKTYKYERWNLPRIPTAKYPSKAKMNKIQHRMSVHPLLSKKADWAWDHMFLKFVNNIWVIDAHKYHYCEKSVVSPVIYWAFKCGVKFSRVACKDIKDVYLLPEDIQTSNVISSCLFITSVSTVCVRSCFFLLMGKLRNKHLKWC